MEKKQGFFSALKDEVVRGLSPSRSRASSPARSGSPMTGLLRRKKQNHHGNGHGVQLVAQPDALIGRSGSLRPVMEGPDPDGGELGDSKRVGSSLGQWMRGQLSRTPSVSSVAHNNSKSSDLRLLLGVMGAPLAPLHVSTSDPFPHLSIKDTPIETSSAQYILQQYTAASGGQKLQNSIKNAYAMGKVRMVASEFETATKVMKTRNASRCAESGGFVLWQMSPDMWYVELAVGGSKVHAGCNGSLSGGTHRGLGLDPRSTASMFTDARCIGERKINGEDCFILKLSADPQTLKARSEGPAEIIRHVLFGYFSQKTGLLVHMEDSHLTRIQSNGGDAVYWETTINSFLDDYRPVEGIMIAHSGRSVVTLFRFGEMAMSHTKNKDGRSLDNRGGLSMDCFIPPADLRSGTISEASELPHDERGKGGGIAVATHRAKVAALEKEHNANVDSLTWKMEV
ncbi:hypothetical protein DVH24_034333 [Malus domestica]|uniref:DUF620 domain-containing protein n=1 Tax=Malus domestica TaxID=3750 RepID=A0A498J0V8_MALDO|nr:hypothetical protein DVH24_034333 [Malus domestica]